MKDALPEEAFGERGEKFLFTSIQPEQAGWFSVTPAHEQILYEIPQELISGLHVFA